MKRVVSGIQPTGSLTLGNYLGAIRNWIAFLHTHECLFFMADLHSWTVLQDPAKLAEQCRLVAAAYIASGIDPTVSSIFMQSHVAGHSELAWLLNCITPLGWLNRMTQFKDKAGKDKEKANLGLYAYPVLMAADILLYKATHVPVGDDQKQHLELTRDIAGAFNQTFGETFILPEPMILGQATRVMSLRDGTAKMSKSDPSDLSRINLMDDADTIIKKIKKAKSDAFPLPGNSDDLADRPEAKNLLNIYSVFADKPLLQCCLEFEGANFSALKEALADVLVTALTPIRTEMVRLMNEPHYLDKILAQGKDKALSIAAETLKEVHQKMGMLKV
ncbi:tryptophan--tRNA ligase [Candidatus Bodocaedibacter vickermanii]|uniref:Tryptophan--tRNA ligase n=1 Tax=Candidatus Bodocaedibacter vickermanii TaxID=2741701 RepID=A0A7L9RSN2_9PROT|nr:Tryptophan--tRNA ligase [Candidatus Paracaedibacteraceae bacterium 'Lake Konstanz']